jgi:hypothetical protein
VLYKPGVDSDGIHPAVHYAEGVIRALYARRNFSLTATSYRDGVHLPHSLHYKGRAVDFRTRHLPTTTVALIVEEAKGILYPEGFDVVNEHETKKHIHVEYDPKPGRQWRAVGEA